MSEHRFKPAFLLTTAQAARLLGVHAASVLRWASRGRIRAITTPGGRRRIPLDEIERMWSGPLRRPKSDKGANL